MELNSCLYETEIMHHRLTPKEHRFTYKFFSFYFDLDEIDILSRKIWGLSRNRFNAYGFYDKDYIPRGKSSVKENVLDYLAQKGIDLKGGKIMLLTNVRTFGYIFNPVSFYYCFDSDGNSVCVIPEIGNTFGELKLFTIDSARMNNDTYKDTQEKFYYISPFTNLDDQLDFRLSVPNERLNIRIDTAKNNGKIILTSMIGTRSELTNKNLLTLTLWFPFITLKVISLIHIHAAILHFVKKVPYHKKGSNLHLQKGVQNEFAN